jgi:arsenate reductase (thioredoxin)
MNTHRPYNVLFVCNGNSARSIMAEAIMNRLGAGKFKAYSAGVTPRDEVHPRTIKLLQSLHHTTDTLKPKSWKDFAAADAPPMDFIITLGDEAMSEPTPVWPGHPIRSHWGLPDPTVAEGTDVEVALAFADAYRMLNNRIGIFVNLPFEKLDALGLQRRLDDIGGGPNRSPALA